MAAVGGSGGFETTVSWTGYQSKRTQQPEGGKTKEVGVGRFTKSTAGVGTMQCGQHKALVFDESQMKGLDWLSFKIARWTNQVDVKEISLKGPGGKEMKMYVSTSSLVEAGGINAFTGVKSATGEDLANATVTAKMSQLRQAIQAQNGDPNKVEKLRSVKEGQDPTVTIKASDILAAFTPAAPSRGTSAQPTQTLAQSAHKGAETAQSQPRKASEPKTSQPAPAASQANSAAFEAAKQEFLSAAKNAHQKAQEWQSQPSTQAPSREGIQKGLQELRQATEELKKTAAMAQAEHGFNQAIATAKKAAEDLMNATQQPAAAQNPAAKQQLKDSINELKNAAEALKKAASAPTPASKEAQATTPALADLKRNHPQWIAEKTEQKQVGKGTYKNFTAGQFVWKKKEQEQIADTFDKCFGTWHGDTFDRNVKNPTLGKEPNNWYFAIGLMHDIQVSKEPNEDLLKSIRSLPKNERQLLANLANELPWVHQEAKKQLNELAK